jgi:hypothetical protein
MHRFQPDIKCQKWGKGYQLTGHRSEFRKQLGRDSPIIRYTGVMCRRGVTFSGFNVTNFGASPYLGDKNRSIRPNLRYKNRSTP